LTANQG
jgi:hypothetical protein